MFFTCCSQVLECKVELVADLITHDPADADPAWLGQSFEPRRDIDSVSVDITPILDGVAQIDAHAEFEAAIWRHIGISLGHFALYFNCATHRIDDAGWGGAAAGVQYHDQLYHEHRLAKLRWRDNFVQFQPDGGDHLPDVYVGHHGFVVAMAFIRAFTVKDGGANPGDFYRDLIRFTTRVLLPVSLALATFMIWQGAPTDIGCRGHSAPGAGDEQTVAIGPVASLETIKHLGTNCGGFFNANAAHPFENPTPLSNWLLHNRNSFRTVGKFTLGSLGNVARASASGTSVPAARDGNRLSGGAMPYLGRRKIRPVSCQRF
jgi:hypothetical protein